MKREPHRPEVVSFADRMRERLVRGTDAARRMIERVRELVEHDKPGATHTSARPSRTQVTPAPVVSAVPRPGKTSAARTPVAAVKAVPTSTATGTATDDDAKMDLAPEFATATMGNILYAQGRYREAAAVYEKLLARNPRHSEALRGLERCREALREPTKPAAEAPVPEPSEMLDRAPPPSSYHRSEVRALPVDPGSVVVFWEMTPEALAEAGTKTGWGAAQSICVVSVLQGVRGVERSERYLDDVMARGNFFVRDLPTGATHHVAIGLHKGGQFVPIAYARPVSTPRGRPSRDVSRVRATVALPPADRGQLLPAPRIVAVQGPDESVSQLVQQTAPSALSEAVKVARVPAEPVSPAAPEPFDYDEPTGGMPSSADLARRRGRGAGGGAEGMEAGGAFEEEGWTSSGQWRSSGQWTSSGQWPSSGQWTSSRPWNSDRHGGDGRG